MRCLFLSLNVDGVFLHTTKKFFACNCVFILFFTFLFFCFTVLLLCCIFGLVFYKTKSSLVSLLRFFDLMFLKSCCVFLSVVVFCTFGPPYCSAGQMNNFLLH